jgi:hypothetical protein
MALFDGEDLVTVPGPNGPIQVPRSVASALALPQPNAPAPQNINAGEYGNLAGLPPPLPPPPPVKKIGPMGAPIEETAGPTPQAAPIPDAVSAAGPRAADSVQQVLGQIANKDEGVDAVSGPPGTGPTFAGNAPQIGPQRPGAGGPKPLTGKDLGGENGIANAYNASSDATQQQIQAGRNVANVEALGQDAMASAYDKQIRDNAALAQKRFDDAAAAQKAVEAKNAQIAQARQKIANTKIDRESDHPILNTIGILLAGLGSAMLKQSTNPAFDMLQAALKRKVDGQMADIEKRRGDLAGMREDVGDMAKAATNKSALYDGLLAAQTDRAALTIKKIAAQSNSDVLKANADKMVADLQQQAASLQMNAADKQVKHEDELKKLKVEEQNNIRSVGAQNYATSVHAKIAKDELKFKYDELDAKMAESIAAANAKGNAGKAKELAEAAKENSQRGVGNAVTGEVLLQPAGKQKMLEAADLEAKASKLDATNKGAADAYRAKAQQIREGVLSDETNGVWRANDPGTAHQLSQNYAEAQNVVSLSNQIKQLAAEHGKDWFSTDAGRAQIQTKVAELIPHLQASWGFKRLSQADIDLIGDVTGKDPTKMTTAQLVYQVTNTLGNDPDAYKARFDALAADTKKATFNEFHAHKYRGDVKDLFGEESSPTKTDAAQAYQTLQQEKTPDEHIAANDTSGVNGAVVNAGQRLFYPLSKTTREQNDERAGSSMHNGALSDKQYQAAQTMLDSYRSGKDPRAGELLLEAATDAKRPDLALGVMRELRDGAPNLYKAAKQRAPKEIAGQIDYEDKAAQAGSDAFYNNMTLPQLAGSAIVNDTAFKKLSVAASVGAPGAQQWLDAVIKRRGGNAGLPAGTP